MYKAQTQYVIYLQPPLYLNTRNNSGCNIRMYFLQGSNICDLSTGISCSSMHKTSQRLHMYMYIIMYIMCVLDAFPSIQSQCTKKAGHLHRTQYINHRHGRRCTSVQQQEWWWIGITDTPQAAHVHIQRGVAVNVHAHCSLGHCSLGDPQSVRMRNATTTVFVGPT